jgi:PAS domain S-box-containing protein
MVESPPSRPGNRWHADFNNCAMSDRSERSFRNTPPFGWAVPIAQWGEKVAQSKARNAHLGHGNEIRGASAAELEALSELRATFEELSVAEEELRAQNETLERTAVELERERERYRLLFHRAPVAYLVTDANGVITNANAAASQLLHCRADRLLGKPLALFVQDASRRRLRRVLSACRELEAETITAKLNLIPRQAPLVQSEATIAVSSGVDGKVLEVRWLLIDQTERAHREEMEQQRAAELEALVASRTAELQRTQQLKDELIATVSHEFRTALSAIGGYADLLTLGVRGPLTSPQLADVDRIQHAYQHLAKLVDDLLRYNKLSAGQVALQIDDVSLADTLRGVTDLISPQAVERGIVVESTIERMHVAVRVDPERVRQIVLNLLSNAVKFADPNSTVRLLGRIEGGSALVEVVDTGPGIPSDKLDVIFEPFVRLSGSTVGGTGLGLAISRQMARAMEGDVSVTSEPGRETRFVLRVPLSTRLAQPSLSI